MDFEDKNETIVGPAPMIATKSGTQATCHHWIEHPGLLSSYLYTMVSRFLPFQQISASSPDHRNDNGCEQNICKAVGKRDAVQRVYPDPIHSL